MGASGKALVDLGTEAITHFQDGLIEPYADAFGLERFIQGSCNGHLVLGSVGEEYVEFLFSCRTILQWWRRSRRHRSWRLRIPERKASVSLKDCLLLRNLGTHEVWQLIVELRSLLPHELERGFHSRHARIEISLDCHRVRVLAGVSHNNGVLRHLGVDVVATETTCGVPK